MLCRSCGTEIADRAIICFRCGASTTDPVRKAAIIKPRRGPLVSLVVIVMLLLLALYMGQTAQTAADPDPFTLAAGLCAGAAAVVLILRVLRRRK